MFTKWQENKNRKEKVSIMKENKKRKWKKKKNHNGKNKSRCISNLIKYNDRDQICLLKHRFSKWILKL